MATMARLGAGAIGLLIAGCVQDAPVADCGPAAEIELVDARLAEMLAEALAAEAVVENLRAAQYPSIPSSTTDMEMRISALQAELIQARADLEVREAYLRAAQQYDFGAGSPPAIRDLAIRRAETARRLAEFEPDLPPQPETIALRAQIADLDAEIEHEIARIVTSLRNDVEVARERVEAITAELVTRQAALAAIDAELIRMRELERDAFAKRKLYDAYAVRADTLRPRASAQGSPSCE